MTGEVAAREVVGRFARDAASLGWVDAVWVGGSLATGDYRPTVSDLDLVVLTDGLVDDGRREDVRLLHERQSALAGPGRLLGAVWVDRATLLEIDRRHPTWTHGRLVDRHLSRIARAELHRHGYAVCGASPADLLPAPSPDDLRVAVRSELEGYWRWAVRRPWLWLRTGQADLALTTMARAAVTLGEGRLPTKSEALERLPELGVRARTVARARARRRGGAAGVGPAAKFLDAIGSWRLTRRMVAVAGRR